MAEPSKEEYQLIRELSEKAKDILNSDEQKIDQFLVRWIRARDGDIVKAETMLREAIQWRQSNGVDQALSVELSPSIQQNFPFWIESIDKCGRPVIELPIGLWDVRKAMDSPENEEAFASFINYLFEITLHKIRICQKNRKDSNTWPDIQVLAIWNWEGYSYAQFFNTKAVTNILRMGSVYEAYYPEILFKIICVNCPVFFPVLFAMAKRFVAVKTLSKIEMYGKNREQWEPVVREFVDPRTIGIEFGGSDFYRLPNETDTS